MQLSFFGRNIKQSESNVIFYIKELQSNIERLLNTKVMNNIEEYHRNADEYHKILKSKYQKRKVYFLDKIEFSKFYVPPLLNQVMNHNDNFYQRHSWYSNYNENDTFYSYDGWKHIFDSSNFVYVIGGPGYGKSLFLTKLINDYEQLNFLNNEEYLIIYGDLKKFISNDGHPMSMLEYLQNSMITESSKDKKNIPKEMIEYYIDSGRCLLLFDALDEVEKNKRDEVHENIVNYFEIKNPNNKICITSRSRGFIPENNHIVYEIQILERKQIEKYLSNLIKLGKFDKEDQEIFLKQAMPLLNNQFLNSFLILSLLLHIFKAERNLPDTKIALYEKCFEYISYKREKEKNQKYNWNDLLGLMDISMFSTLSSMGLPNNNDIDKKNIMNMICENYSNQFGTPQNALVAAENFLNYCSERTELFVLSSQEDKFHFFHRSFFDFFYSNYLLFQVDNIEDIFNCFKKFDVDSEVFELTFALIKKNNKIKYQKLVEYIFEKCEEEINEDDDNGISAFNILTLGMQVIDDIGYRDKYISFLINQKEYIINYLDEILNDKLYAIIEEKDEYIDCIVDQYCAEAELDILNPIFLFIYESNDRKKKYENSNELIADIGQNLIYECNTKFYCLFYIMKKNLTNFFEEKMNLETFNRILENNCISNEGRLEYLEFYRQYNDFGYEMKKEIENTLNNALNWLKNKRK